MTHLIGDNKENRNVDLKKDDPFNLCQDRVVIPVHHVQQRFNWDCGIACVMMILNQEQREYFYKDFKEICLREGFGTSVWSIDLAFLLKRFDIPFTYCTITLGADPNYSKESYYSKVMVMDENRINQRFQNAAEQQIKVEKRSLKLTEILLHLSSNNPAIFLVNANLLHCDECEVLFCQRCKCNFFSCGCFAESIPYDGHFVTVCGYDMNQHKILYRNPSFQNKLCCTSFESFEAARQSYGTDEDILLIKMNQI